MRLTLPAMDLGLVVRSHGWYDLPPFEWLPAERRLNLIFLEGIDPVRVVVEQRANGLLAAASSPFKENPSSGLSSRAVRRVLDRVLNLKADLSSFHSACAGDPRFAWIARRGAGRILRAPSLFEDAVKVLATTNCTWGLTKLMVRSLVERFDRGGAFPDAPFVAGLPARALVAAKLGYRAPYLAAFAGRVASGKLDLARWEDPGLPDEEVEKEIRAEKGFGPYAADTLGRLLGRHRKLGLDSWSRKKVASLRFRGRAVKDARVARFYAPFGPHAGLAFWLDVTRHWHEEKEGLWP
ncbi:MAG: Fe-S cluster assembly protein HesB [Thermoanaerobaculia bacterium]|nr:Fe-S cluster assembly protein HesB [Thermoanaerobaculia bacterium]